MVSRPRRVVKRKGLRVLGVDLHRLGLGGRVDGVAVDGPGFLHHDGAGDAGNVDFSMGVGGIQAIGGQVPVGIVHVAAARVGQLKFHPGQRLAGGLVQFTNDKFASPLIPEGERGSALARFDLHALGVPSRTNRSTVLTSWAVMVWRYAGATRNVLGQEYETELSGVPPGQ